MSLPELIVDAVSAARRPDPEAVRDLYRKASALAPLSEGEETAELYAKLYRWSLMRPDVLVISATEGDQLIGLAYGHPWRWPEQTDDWATLLRERLGERASTRLNDSFAVELLVVDPGWGGNGIGRRLLRRLLAEANASTCWLQTTDMESPARRLYRAEGWTVVSSGPDAPDGRPGVVLISPNPCSPQ